MFKCNFCPLKYANKSNRSRHERDNYFVEKGLIVYRCKECSFTAQMLSNLQKHILHTHGQLGGVCDYCHLGFHSPKNLSAHLLATHGLPVMRAASADLATTSAAANDDSVMCMLSMKTKSTAPIFKKVSLLFSVFLKRM